MLNFSAIIPGRFWVGGYVRPEDVPQLEQMEITAVICLQTDMDLRRFGVSPADLARAYGDAGIEWRRVPIPDFDRKSLARNLPAAVRQVEDVLANPDARLYLHCTEGISRAPTTAAGFLITSLAKPTGEAWCRITSQRDCSPDLAILEQFAASRQSGTG
jgi:protein-tyrosine phosphatase